MNPNPPPPPPPPPPPSEPVQTTTWFQRNKGWAIPVGCIGLLIVLGCCGLGGVALWGAKKGIDVVKSATVFHGEVAETLRNDPRVAEAVGEPVTVGTVVAPNYQNQNGVVDYRFQLPVSGPNAQGTAYVQAGSADGVLQVQRMELEVGGETIQLAP